MGRTAAQLAKRDLEEIRRSAVEASRIELKLVDTDRYLDPPADTMHGLEYAFHLLGDVRNKTVLDLGCGSGENLIPLLRRGAKVIGMDISPELIAVARARLEMAGMQAVLKVGSAYETGLESSSVDVVFCMSLVHHLDIAMAREEMRRLLVPAGLIIVKEPVRFSKAYARLRSLLPSHGDNSEYEHPITRDEWATLTKGFMVEKTRFFRLPIVPLAERALGWKSPALLQASNWALDRAKFLQRFATIVVAKLTDQVSSTRETSMLHGS
jgi:SAM-dependent methyltransferase